MVTRLRRRGPSPRHRNHCDPCDGYLARFPVGADVAMSLLFADIRGSTEHARGATPGAVRDRIAALLTGATDVTAECDGFVMAFHGDRIVACWPPGCCAAPTTQPRRWTPGAGSRR